MMQPRYWMDDDIRIVADRVFVAHFVRYQFACDHIGAACFPTVLDAGCGTGYGSWMMHCAGFQVLGVDKNRQVVDWATSMFAGPTFAVANLEEHDPQLGPFDLIVGFEFLEHLEHPGRVLVWLQSYLKPGGGCFLSIPIDHPDTKFHKHQFNTDDALKLVTSCPWGQIDFWRQTKGNPFIQSVGNSTEMDTLVAFCRKAETAR